MDTATLTLSHVEQTAVLRHLVLQHSRLDPRTEDRPILDVLMAHISQDRTVSLTQVEAIVMLRYVRKQLESLTSDMVALEERRLRGGFNGSLEAAHRALDADKYVLEDVARRLWEIVL